MDRTTYLNLKDENIIIFYIPIKINNQITKKCC